MSKETKMTKASVKAKLTSIKWWWEAGKAVVVIGYLLFSIGMFAMAVIYALKIFQQLSNNAQQLILAVLMGILFCNRFLLL